MFSKPFQFLTSKVRSSMQFTNKYYYKQSKFIEDKLSQKNSKFDHLRKQELYYNIGLYGIVFALCWAAVPFYKLFCEHFGLDGDLAQKDYSQMSKRNKDIHRKYRLIFKAEMDPQAQWDFEPVQHEVIVSAGESALVFYRAYNKEDQPIVGFSTYQIFPEDASLYFAKIQCFCFNQQLLNPKEELFLPIYFYLEPEINDDPVIKNIQDIVIQYRFFKSKNQDLAKLAEDEIRKVKRNKFILMKMRAKANNKELGEKEFNEIKNMGLTDQDIDEFNEYDMELELISQQEDQDQNKKVGHGHSIQNLDALKAE